MIIGKEQKKRKSKQNGEKHEKLISTTEAIFPTPVLLISTFNEDGTVDVMNAAWVKGEEIPENHCLFDKFCHR